MVPRRSALKFTKTQAAVAVLLAGLIPGQDFVDHWKVKSRTALSPSAEYMLRVTPSNDTGEGTATYRLSRGPEVVWSGERPSSLREFEVLDDGRVVGYAYEGGVRWTVWHGMRFEGLTVIFFDSEGKYQLRESGSEHKAGKLEPWRRMDHSDSPEVRGMLVDLANDQFIVRIRPAPLAVEPSVWWVFRLSTGERIGDLVPPHPGAPLAFASREVSAHLVPGTPLTLVHWYVPAYSGSQPLRGASLYLLNNKAELVWTKDLPTEYEGMEENWIWASLLDEGSRQARVEHKSFSFRSKEQDRVLDFCVQKDPEATTGWRVEAKQKPVDEHDGKAEDE